MSETNEFEIYEIWLKSICVKLCVLGNNESTRKVGCENCCKYSRDHSDRIGDLINDVLCYC